MTADVGAYSIYPFSCSLEVATTATALFAPYRLEAIRLHGRALASNRCPAGAYRGVGTVVAVHSGVHVFGVPEQLVLPAGRTLPHRPRPP